MQSCLSFFLPCTTQASSLEFLANHGFDFNRFIRDGISYLPGGPSRDGDGGGGGAACQRCVQGQQDVRQSVTLLRLSHACGHPGLHCSLAPIPNPHTHTHTKQKPLETSPPALPCAYSQRA